MRSDRSILDATTESLRRLERRLGAGDRTRVGEYLDTVRDVERRIRRAEENNASTPLPELEQPAGVPDGYAEHLSLLYDLLALAFQADVTRASCTQVAREQSGRTYPEIGVPVHEPGAQPAGEGGRRGGAHRRQHGETRRGVMSARDPHRRLPRAERGQDAGQTSPLS